MQQKILRNFIAVVVLLCTATVASAQLSGTVFKDYNFDGVQQTTGSRIESGAYGVVVSVFNNANVQLASVTTDFNGTYIFTAAQVPNGTNVRVEFSPISGQFSARVAAAASSSNVQFVTAGAAVTANYAVATEHWYSSTDNPYLITNAFTNGNPSATGVGEAGLNNNVHIFPWLMGNGTQDNGGTTRRLQNSQVGSIFGIAYQHTTRTALMAAYVKRHAGLGPNGIGAIYQAVVDASGVPSTASLMVNLEAAPFNIDFGTDPRATGPALPNDPSQRNTDPNAYAKVGKEGIGGIDLSDDGTELFVVNMFDQKLYKINIGNPIKASFTAADLVSYTIATNSGTLNWRPMAVKYFNGAVYVGGVFVSEKSGGAPVFADTVGQRIAVYKLDVASNTVTEVLRHGLNYRRGFSNSDLRYPIRNNFWCGWQNDGSFATLVSGYNAFNGTNTGGIYYPQPMLADLEFDTDGSIILGLRDRFGDQVGYQNLSTDGLPQFGFSGTMATPTNNYFRGLTSADLLKAGANSNGTFSMESAGSTTSYGKITSSIQRPFGNPSNVNADWGATPTGIAGSPLGGLYGPDWSGTAASQTLYTGGTPPTINQGTTGNYFFYNQNFTSVGVPLTLNNITDSAIKAHYHKAEGGLATLAGSNEIAFTAMDPVTDAFTNGALRISTANGNMTQRLVLTTTATNNPTNMGKANAVGDLELLTDAQPIQIGNRIWFDTDADGLQDAGEAGVNNVAVQLVSPGVDNIFGNGNDVVVASTNTNASGEYYFTNLTTSDARRPASFTGLPANVILPGFDYQIQILNAIASGGNTQQTPLVGFNPTKFDAAANSLDNIDNDGVLVGTTLTANFNSHFTNHNFDFGFKTSASLGNKVWRDDNKDGTQDPGEPGVAGITVSLFQNGPDNVPGGTDDIFIKSTVTDAYGMYLFENLTPSTTGQNNTIYNVVVTLPSNYQFTTQTNTQTAAGASSNTVAVGAAGSDANNNSGQTGGFFLSPGESERDVDAGIIFSTPAAKSSIGDRVWLDNGAGANASNGVQNTDEPGVAGVTVSLYKETVLGSNIYTLFMTTKTDAKGNYLFNDLPNDMNYQVGITLPAGATLTSTTGGSVTTANNSTNSDINLATLRTTTINIPIGGASYRGVDAGLILIANNKCAIGDRVWHDLNRDGDQDAGEPGIAGVTVELYAANKTTLLGTRITDAYGNYVFTDLDASNGTTSSANGYYIKFGTVAGLQLTQPNIGANTTLDDVDSDAAASGFTPGYFLSPGERNMSVDAGFYSTSAANTVGALGDKVWIDDDGDNIQDANEKGLAGVKVILCDNAGNPIGFTATDENGRYLFPNLTPGNYSVKFENLPDGFSLIKSKEGSDNTVDSDASVVTGKTANAAITGGNTTTTLDAGIRQGINSGLGSLGNRVWYDISNGTTGKQDLTETGVRNVTVQLYLDADNNGTIAGAELTAVQTTTTNALGEYIFKGLNAGNYQVGFSNLPAGFTLTTKNAATISDAENSDGNTLGAAISGNTAVAGKTYTDLVSLAQGEDKLTVDLGIVPPANTNTLGDIVWFDTNKNGVQDFPTEPGVPGAVVTLFNGAGTAIATTTTDANGQYLFVNLADANFSVGFSQLPNGFDFTSRTIATTTGSDADLLTGATPQVTLNSTNRNDRTLDAGIITDKAALGNYVWFDADRDGVQDATEDPLAGATVTLYRPGFGLDGLAGTPDDALGVASAVTNGVGYYFFPNLDAGTYQVEFTTIPTNTIFTSSNVTTGGGTDINDSDVNPATGLTANYTLAAGQVNPTVDAGVTIPLKARIGNRVWADLDANGRQDAGEPGVAGVLVTLFDASNNKIGSAVTNGEGFWQISNLDAGTGFYVIFDANITGFVTAAAPTGAQMGWTSGNNAINPNAGDALDAATESDTDSDVIQIGANAGRTTAFAIVVGADYINIDAGIITVKAFVVPIQLVSFGANQVGSTVLVNWVVATEIDVNRYEVEYSSNGQNFVSINSIAANNNRNYNALHTTPLNGFNYYRLKVIDNNGTVSYSSVKRIYFGKSGIVKLYPNPATAELTIELPTAFVGKNTQVVVYAANGATLIKQSFIGTNAKININTATLPSGHYLLSIVADNELVSHKFTVIR